VPPIRLRRRVRVTTKPQTAPFLRVPILEPAEPSRRSIRLIPLSQKPLCLLYQHPSLLVSQPNPLTVHTVIAIPPPVACHTYLSDMLLPRVTVNQSSNMLESRLKPPLGARLARPSPYPLVNAAAKAVESLALEAGSTSAAKAVSNIAVSLGFLS